jgi:hypothetical protein
MTPMTDPPHISQCAMAEFISIRLFLTTCVEVMPGGTEGQSVFFRRLGGHIFGDGECPISYLLSLGSHRKSALDASPL